MGTPNTNLETYATEDQEKKLAPVEPTTENDSEPVKETADKEA